MRRGSQRLLVVRHAKAGYPEGVADHERPLTDRGVRDARNVGEWLAAERFVPDLVLCSTSVRTRQTWELAAEVLGADVEVQHERRLYAADADTVLDIVRTYGGEHHTVAVVGHEPGLSTMAQSVADPDASDPDELAGLRDGFPTAAVVVLRPRLAWADIEPGTVPLTRLAVPRGGADQDPS